MPGVYYRSRHAFQPSIRPNNQRVRCRHCLNSFEDRRYLRLHLDHNPSHFVKQASTPLLDTYSPGVTRGWSRRAERVMSVPPDEEEKKKRDQRERNESLAARYKEGLRDRYTPQDIYRPPPGRVGSERRDYAAGYERNSYAQVTNDRRRSTPYRENHYQTDSRRYSLSPPGRGSRELRPVERDYRNRSVSPNRNDRVQYNQDRSRGTGSSNYHNYRRPKDVRRSMSPVRDDCNTAGPKRYRPQASPSNRSRSETAETNPNLIPIRNMSARPSLKSYNDETDEDNVAPYVENDNED